VDVIRPGKAPDVRAIPPYLNNSIMPTLLKGFEFSWSCPVAANTWHRHMHLLDSPDIPSVAARSRPYVTARIRCTRSFLAIASEVEVDSTEATMAAGHVTDLAAKSQVVCATP
jgi:hypothetical protein